MGFVPKRRSFGEVAQRRVCPIVDEIVAEQDDKDHQAVLAGAGFRTKMAPLVLR
jgi:hypothetical protein